MADDIFSSDINYSAENLYLLYTGALEFHLAPDTSSSNFNSELGFVLNSSNIPYMYVPDDSANFIGSETIYGKMGMIVNTRSGQYSYFIIAGMDEASAYNLCSIRLLHNLGCLDNSGRIVADADTEYTVLLCTDDIQWNTSQSILNQLDERGNKNFGYYQIVTSTSNSNLLDYSNINTDRLYPYIISVNRNTDSVNYQSMINFGVVGVMIEAGYLFDKRHMRQSRYANPIISDQVNACVRNNLPFGMYAITRARTVDESNEEIDNLIPLLRTYSPTLGVWVQLNFLNNQIISLNDAIVDNYKNRLSSIRVGYAKSLGIYADGSTIKTISWEKHCDDWYLWYRNPVSNISDVQRLLTPSDFKIT